MILYLLVDDMLLMIVLLNKSSSSQSFFMRRIRKLKTTTQIRTLDRTRRRGALSMMNLFFRMRFMLLVMFTYRWNLLFCPLIWSLCCFSDRSRWCRWCRRSWLCTHQLSPPCVLKPSRPSRGPPTAFSIDAEEKEEDEDKDEDEEAVVVDGATELVEADEEEEGEGTAAVVAEGSELLVIEPERVIAVSPLRVIVEAEAAIGIAACELSKLSPLLFCFFSVLFADLEPLDIILLLLFASDGAFLLLPLLLLKLALLESLREAVDRWVTRGRLLATVLELVLACDAPDPTAAFAVGAIGCGCCCCCCWC